MRNRLIERWMLLLLVMLLTACHSDDKEEIVIPEDEDCYLDIYVYAPDRPIVTRGDVGEIEYRTKEEAEVHTLQIWVFKNSDGTLVGHLNAGGDDEAYNVTGAKISDTSILNEKGQQVYRMKVDKAFANAPEAVDIYVVANAASFDNKIYVPYQGSYTSTTLDRNTTRAKLNDALFGKIDNVDYFGTTGRYGIADLATNGRIYTNGLPMSAVLKNQPISGKFPTLRIGTESHIATLQLTRAVSKLRFVLCRIDDSNSNKKLVSIDKIQLNSGVVKTSCQIPTVSYLMPGTYSYTNYVSDSINYVETGHSLTKVSGDYYIPKVKDPLAYTYETQSAQEYEDLINKAITGELLANEGDENLKELGLTYLRESDKQLKGTITYTYNENNSVKNTQATAIFKMAAAGDFLRNHSWIVYIYYMDSKIYTLTVTNIGMKSWVSDPRDEKKDFFNW